MLLQLANRLSPKADYLDTCVDQLSWTFGRNYYNRSQVTGLGLNPPMNPHHRPSRADGIVNPWPGLLVGGGNSTSTQAAGNKNGATNWLDDIEAYELNEVAINWNAPLVYALASLLGPQSSGTTSDGGVAADASKPVVKNDTGITTDPPSPDAAAGTSPDTRLFSPDSAPSKSDTASVVTPDNKRDASAAADSAPSKSDIMPKSNNSKGCSCSLGSQTTPGPFLMLALGAGLLARVRRKGR